MVKISGPNRSAKITDHFRCISVNVIYCTTCTLCKKIYIGETGRRLSRCKKKRHRCVKTNCVPFNLPYNSRHSNTPTTTVCALSYTTGTQKAAKISNKNSSFNLVHSLHTGLVSASHSTNLFTNSCQHISTNGKTPSHPHINQQHSTIPLFALTKG